MFKILLLSALLSSLGAISLSDGPWEGVPCVGCVYIVGMTEELSIVHNLTVENSLEKLCNSFPAGLFRDTCKAIIVEYGEVIINGIYSHETPDIICHLLNFCSVDNSTEQCHLFPLPQKAFSVKFEVKRFEKYLKYKNIHIPKKEPNICKNALFKPLCDYIKFVFTYREPAFDFDGDRHSEYLSLRGTSWRGKDCNDYDSNVRPGRKPNGLDELVDTNCNGIYGINLESKQSYEEMFCKNSSQIGVAVLGDSISAHFHIPEQWFDATQLNEASFEHIGFFLENELDWPQLSALTGYMNSTWFVTQGPTRSIYLNMFNRNRCNFRDYQNIAVNGAWTETMKNKFSKGLKRDPDNDQPLLLYFSLIGNDVCNSANDTLNNMTKPADFYNNIVTTLQYLDTVLPNGSHVLLTGSILHDVLNDRIHPVGKVKNDVTYGQFYTYLTCLKLSPCNGWMTANATLSKLTTEYAMILSGIVKNISQTLKFNNFDMAYIDLPVNQIFARWEAMGGEIWQLIEPIDGFHMNQYANALLADELWSILTTKYPKWIGEINPFNDQILKIFGDQNGY